MCSHFIEAEGFEVGAIQSFPHKFYRTLDRFRQNELRGCRIFMLMGQIELKKGFEEVIIHGSRFLRRPEALSESETS